MTKASEELAQEYVIGEFPDTNSDMFLAAESVHKAFLAGYTAGFERAVQLQASLAAGRSESKWTSPKSCLPSFYETVFCYQGHGENAHFFSAFVAPDGQWLDPEDVGFEASKFIEKVDGWMRPAPPKEEE